jgi:hypothetical protein
MLSSCPRFAEEWALADDSQSASYDENQIVGLGVPRLQHALLDERPFWVGVGEPDLVVTSSISWLASMSKCGAHE